MRVTFYSDKVAVRLSREQFEEIVERALEGIPSRFRSRMRNVAVLVSARGPSPDLLGLYEGRPAGERSSLDTLTEGPDRIHIFQQAHEEMARSKSELERLATDTVWHEVGHYFGMNEREILAVEERWARRRSLSALRSLRRR